MEIGDSSDLTERFYCSCSLCSIWHMTCSAMYCIHLIMPFLWSFVWFVCCVSFVRLFTFASLFVFICCTFCRLYVRVVPLWNFQLIIENWSHWMPSDCMSITAVFNICIWNSLKCSVISKRELNVWEIVKNLWNFYYISGSRKEMSLNAILADWSLYQWRGEDKCRHCCN